MISRVSVLLAFFLSTVLVLLLPAGLRADPVVRFDEKSGLFEIKYKSVPIVTARFAFWRDKWKWTGSSVRTG